MLAKKLAALLVALGLLVPAAARSGEADETPTPPTERGKADEEGDEKKKDEETPGGEGAGEEKGGGEEPAPPPKEEPPAEEEEEEEPETPKPAPEAPAVPTTPPIPSSIPGPAGMVYLAGGEVEIGSKPEEIQKDAAGRDPAIRNLVAFERPRHKRKLIPYFIDRYEVSNAQYLLFLQDVAATTYDTGVGNLPNLVEIAGFLLSTEKDRIDKDDVSWRQIYRSNKEILWKKMPKTVVKQGDAVDEKATEEAFKHALLAKGIALRFYSKNPPRDWWGMEPLPEERKRPVTWVTYNDAEHFAEWAGKHVVTEPEWEHAARGPELRRYPWGDDWYRDATHANWGGKVLGPDYRPRKTDVDDPAFGLGQSWIGCWHMLGNVAEWTSTWFDAYPGAGTSQKHANTGTYAKVIRGASLIDEDPIALRLAYRNFIGRGPEAPPIPSNRFEWVGFRCAWYLEPGRDQYYPTVRRAVRGRALTDADFSFDAVVGAVATHFAPSEADAKDAVYVVGPAKSIVAIPRKFLIAPEDETKKRWKKVEAILEASKDEKTPDPILLGALHTDVPLEKLWVVKPVPVEEGGGRRKKAAAQSFMPGACRPGTYLVAVWHGKLCLVTPQLELAGYLTEKELDGKKGQFQIKEIAPEEAPPAKMEVDDSTDIVDCTMSLPLGGKGNENLHVVVRVLLNTEAGQLSKAGAWRTK